MEKYLILAETELGLLLLNPHGNAHPLASQALEIAKLPGDVSKQRAMFALEELVPVVEFVKETVQGRLYVNGVFPLYFVTAISSPLISIRTFDPKLGKYVNEHLSLEEGPKHVQGIVRVFKFEEGQSSQ